MKKTLVAHLGAHKTATSLVQKYFKAKSKHYQSQGIKFLTRGQVSPYISWGDQVIENGEAFTKFLKEQAKKSKAETLLFSNENALGKPFPRRKGIYPHHGPIIKAFKEATKDFDTKVAFGIRPQVDFLQSYYLQRIHQGDYMTFNQFVDDIDLATLSWRPLVEALKESFGEENVTILDFNLIKKGQIGFIQHFLDVTVGPGINVDAEYDDVINPSISDRGLHLALRINPLLRKGETSLVRKFLQEHFSNRTEPRPILVSDDLRNRLDDFYGEEYQELISK